MMLCSNLYVKGLLSQMLITRSEIAFKHMYMLYMCAFFSIWFACLFFCFCFALFYFKYILGVVINSNYSCSGAELKSSLLIVAIKDTGVREGQTPSKTSKHCLPLNYYCISICFLKYFHR